MVTMVVFLEEEEDCCSLGGGSGLRMEDVSRVVLDRGGGAGFSRFPSARMESRVVEEVRQIPESSKELPQLPPRLWCGCGCMKLLGGTGGG